MSQDSMVVANDTGANVRAKINSALAAAVTRNSGATAPPTTYADMVWLDTTNGIRWRRNAANTGWVFEGSLSDTPVASVTSAITTFDKSYFGRDLMCSGTFGITLDTIANLGAGFISGRIMNQGSGVITLNAASTEAINGTSSIELPPGASIVLFCDGSSIFADIRGRGVATGYFTHDMSIAETVSITGLGFKPRIVQLKSAVGGGSSAWSSGESDGTNEQCVNVDTSGNANISNAFALIVYSSGVDAHEANLAMTADGFDITWSNTGSPIGTAKISYLARG